MGIYTIKDLEQLSDIKAHTLRVWEQRYGILQPQRTQTNIRYYTDEDLRHLLCIAFLNKNGFKISQIAELNQAQISDKVTELSQRKLQEGTQFDALILAMISLDEEKLEQIINANTEALGFDGMMNQVVFPFLDKLNTLWLLGSVKQVQEQFVSQLIRRKLFAAIEQIAPQRDLAKPLIVIYQPEGLNAELSLLYLYYLLRRDQKRVIYLGTGIGIGDMQQLCKQLNPLATYAILGDEPSHKFRPVSFMKNICEQIPSTEHYFSGYFAINPTIKIPDNGKIVSNLSETINWISTI